MLGYCMKCKMKREFEPTENKTFETKRGIKYAKSGICPECKTKIFLLVKSL